MIAGKVLNSPIRWAGSKKKILVEMLNAFKPNRENYIECFLGSGVVLINVLKKNNTLNYKNFYVNDINPHIINFYKLLQNNPHHIIKQIGELVEVYNNYDMPKKEEYYYELKMRFNEEKDLYIYLKGVIKTLITINKSIFMIKDKMLLINNSVRDDVEDYDVEINLNEVNSFYSSNNKDSFKLVLKDNTEIELDFDRNS